MLYSSFEAGMKGNEIAPASSFYNLISRTVYLSINAADGFQDNIIC